MQQTQQPTPQQTFLQAKGAYSLGDYFEASKHSGMLKAHFPDQPPILAINGIVFSRMGLDKQALGDLQRAANMTEQSLKDEDDQKPTRPQIIDQLMLVCSAMCNSLVRLGLIDDAISVIDRALVYDPQRPDALGAKAEALAAQGNADEALKIIEQGIAANPDPIRLLISKARIILSTNATPTPEFLAALTKETERVGLAGCDLCDALRALGDLHDHTGSHDDAFNAFRRAAKLRRGAFNPEAHSKLVNKLIAEWTAEEMGKLVPSDADGSDIVLMIAPPQCGVNEMGAMLGQSGSITTIGPIESMSMIAQRVFGANQGVLRPVPLTPKGIRGKQLHDGAKLYHDQLQGLMKPGSTLSIDTNPFNIWLVGMAAIMLPGVKLVFCRRDPRACVLDVYSADLPGMYPYAGDLVNAASYVSDCNRMMDHWVRVLSDERFECEIIEVEYDEIEKNLAASASDLAGKIGAPSTDLGTDVLLPLRKSPDPKNYEKMLGVVDELFAEISAGA